MAAVCTEMTSSRARTSLARSSPVTLVLWMFPVPDGGPAPSAHASAGSPIRMKAPAGPVLVDSALPAVFIALIMATLTAGPKVTAMTTDPAETEVLAMSVTATVSPAAAALALAWSTTWSITCCRPVSVSESNSSGNVTTSLCWDPPVEAVAGGGAGLPGDSVSSPPSDSATTPTPTAAPTTKASTRISGGERSQPPEPGDLEFGVKCTGDAMLLSNESGLSLLLLLAALPMPRPGCESKSLAASTVAVFFRVAPRLGGWARSGL